jgi:NAD(P)-dependent dehydrogenase (short-subunit alcohol dehydrogenase family)
VTSVAESTQAASDDALGGKVCLVSGGSRTLGSAIVRRLARHGARVVVNYHQSGDAAHALCRELEAGGASAIALQADVTQPDDVERLIDESWARLGPIDLLVNNVGPYVDTPLLDLPLDDFDRILAGNLRATFLLARGAGRRMKQRGSGTIVNIAATDFLHRSHSIYGLAKGGVVHLTQALALELAPEVRINALAPDLIADNEDMAASIAAPAVGGTPLGRLVTRAEIAELVCLLCTPAFAMVTGHTLVVDGGRSIPRIALGPASE